MIAFHDCPGFSTLKSVFAVGKSVCDKYESVTFPALTKNSRLTLSSSAPEVIQSNAADQDVGLPSLVLYRSEVTAIQIARRALGLAISASETACLVIAP